METALQRSPEALQGLSLDAVSALPKSAQDELEMWTQYLPRLAGGEAVTTVCREAAGVLRVGWKAAYRRWMEYQETGDALCLVKRSRLPKRYWNMGFRELPPAFCEYVSQMWARHQRDKFASARNAIVRQWHAWRSGNEDAAIPGYPSCPAADPVTGVPTGWSDTNLRRVCRVSRFARKMVQIGPKSASTMAPPILTTRVGLRVGQFYCFDDSWNDCKVLSRGQCARLLSFHALDLFSGCNVLRGHKPALTDERGVEVRLKEREMVFLVAALLTRYGYRSDGTVMVCEKGTATIREREATLLEQFTGGKVVVKTGPSGGGPGIGGLFTGPGGGNPRWKAPLESWFNLQRNRTADMLEFPAQTGSNSRLNQPEGLERMERDTLVMVKAATTLTPERLELMRLGMLSYQEAEARLDEMVEVINCRTDHDLEGWRNCGHYVTEWRPSPELPWQSTNSLMRLDASAREAVAAMVAGSAELHRERSLSPREVFDAGAADLVKLPMAAAAMLIGDVAGEERPVRNGILEVTCPDLDPDEPLRFGPVLRDGRGTDDPLRDGEKYLVRVNPLAPEVCWLYDARGGWVGVARNWGRVRRDDEHGLQRQFAAKNQWKAAHLAEARRMAAPITRAATAVAEAQRAAILGPGAEPRETRRVVAPEERQSAVEKFLSMGGTAEVQGEEPSTGGQLAALNALGEMEEGYRE